MKKTCRFTHERNSNQNYLEMRFLTFQFGKSQKLDNTLSAGKDVATQALSYVAEFGCKVVQAL